VLGLEPRLSDPSPKFLRITAHCLCHQGRSQSANNLLFSTVD
jgi:hypothetical protein